MDVAQHRIRQQVAHSVAALQLVADLPGWGGNAWQEEAVQNMFEACLVVARASNFVQCLHGFSIRSVHTYQRGADLVGHRLLHDAHVGAVRVQQAAGAVEQCGGVGAGARHADDTVVRQQGLRARGGGGGGGGGGRGACCAVRGRGRGRGGM